MTAFETPSPFVLARTRRKVFVSYHHQADQAYYDAFSKTFHDDYDAIFDNSLERKVDSDNTDYVMRRIRENHVAGTSCTLVLVGEETWGRKYVDWEISATLQKAHGLVGVCLPTAPTDAAGNVKVPDRLHDNIQSGYALWMSWAQVTSSTRALTEIVEASINRDKKLIDDRRPQRQANATIGA